MPENSSENSPENAREFPQKIAPEVRTAIVAAIAAGGTYDRVAKDFKVSRSTVYRFVAESRKAIPGAENPLNWRERHARRYIETIDNRLSEIKDDAKAVAAAQAGLKDLGLTGQKEASVTVKIDQWLASPGAQAAIARVQATLRAEEPTQKGQPDSNWERDIEDKQS